MSTTKALVLRTAGINCDGETVHALEAAGASVELLHLDRLLAEPARLDSVSLVVLPGGFSYGDDIAAGRVFGLELRHGLRRELASFVDHGGHVLGICNGFQVLVESGLFEREPHGPIPERNVALHINESLKFECRWIELRSEACAATWLTAGDTIPCPVAHGEGRFTVRDPATLERLRARGQIALRYAHADGRTAEHYPLNPNGSVEAIAGICDPSGRVLGLMPHPERNLTPWNHPHWTRLSHAGGASAPRTEGEGLRFYRGLVEAAAFARA